MNPGSLIESAGEARGAYGGRLKASTALRTCTAIALGVAATAAMLPAQAQDATAAQNPASQTVAPVSGPAADAPEDQAAPASERDRVYVFGRRVTSSLVTANPANATQVVNVISAETLEEQGVASLEQALRNVPGITTQIGEGGVMSGDQFFIRGLSAKNDVFTDGLRDFGVYTRDSFNYGQVEVFKGPSATAFGRGAAGGGINTSSKTPYGESGGAASLAAGDNDYLRLTADWNQALGDGMAARIAVMSHENEVNGRDRIYSKRWGVAPSIGFGLGANTSMTAAYLHQDEEKVPDYGIPVINGVPGTEYGIDPENFYGYNADIDDTVVDTFTVRLRHAVNDWLNLTSDLKYGYYQRYSRFTPVTCNTACGGAFTDGDPLTVPMGGVGGPGPYEQDTQGVQNITTASITAPVGGLRNELVVGFDASWQHNDRNQFNYDGTRAPKDLFDPAHTPNPTLAAGLNNIRKTTANDVSIFFNDRLWLNDQWSVTAGVRASWYEVDQEQISSSTTVSCRGFVGVACLSSNTDFVTPQVGVIFEPTATQSWYVSYSSSAKPTGASVNNGDTVNDNNSQLDPEENTNLEVGGRMSFLDSRLQLQGAVFQTKKENSKLVDTNGDLVDTSGDSQEISGAEIGIAGALTDQWSLNASYTWLNAETTFSETPTNVGNQIMFTPEHAASLWTTYNFVGALAGLEIGGGLNYQDDVFLNAQNTSTAPSYTTVDGFVSYGWDRYRVSLNGYNLSDELYFSQLHGNRVTPAQGRTFIASLGVVY